MVLEVKSVTKQYKGFTAIRDLSLEFSYGVYGLLAPNGAGKTTLIKMLVTLLYPTKGDISYKGESIYEMDEVYRDLLGYLPQQFGYYKHYTPEKYLMYLSALKGLSKTEAKEKIPELLKEVGLQDVAKKKMKKFSGGMIQRVGIAQALLNNPKLLVLDEPTAGLDPKERARFGRLLTRLSRDRIIILSTHIVSDVETIANEIIMIKDQQLLYKKTQEALLSLLKGSLYEAAILFEEEEDYRERYSIISEKQEKDKLVIRFVTKEESHSSWVAVDPTLEDVFLYVYEEETELSGAEGV